MSLTKLTQARESGYILISSFLVIVLLIGLSGALFLQGINEKLNVDKALVSLRAGYAIEQGMSILIYELLNHQDLNDDNPIPWATHTADTEWPFELHPIYEGTPETLPHTTTGLGAIDTDGSHGGLGCYYRENSNGTRFLAKVYIDTFSPTEKVILVRGCIGDECRLMVTKYSRESLYDYFIFTPFDYDFGWRTFDASGGKIHTNGDVIFYEKATIKNVATLSTPQDVRYHVNSFVPPGNCVTVEGGTTCPDGYNGRPWNEIFWSWRYPYVLPNAGALSVNGNDNEYVNQSDGHLFGNRKNILQGPGEIWDGWGGKEPDLPPLLPDDFVIQGYSPNPELYFVEDYPVVFANDEGDGDKNNDFTLTLPNRLDWPNNYAQGATYQWNIYSQATSYYNYPATNRAVTYTNSGLLSSVWQNFIKNNGVQDLTGIIKEGNSGGNYIAAKIINNGLYEQDAQEGGVYITNDTTGCEAGAQFKATINQSVYCSDSSGRIKFTGGAGAGIVMEKKDFMNTSTARQESVIAIDLERLMRSGRLNPDPQYGIFYSSGLNILMDEALEIPDGGLTVVSDQNVILKGDFNKAHGGYTPQPAAAIAAGYIYALSDDFDYPQNLPNTLHNPNYPDIADGLCPADPRCNGWNGSNLPNEAEETTFNISLVGYYGYDPQILERWNNTQRVIEGSLVRLQEGTFALHSGYTLGTINDVRCCSEGFLPCRNCDLYHDYFTWDMTTYPPLPAALNIFQYDRDYLDPDSPKPPGDLLGFTQAAQLEINNTEDNFNKHYFAIN
ncbi:MAG: hypothetical protein Q8O13_00930 [Candidatus Omnitrophota bacterium]|nr:hypothetical protein [Candidatus Omnitrophota bacterium]